MATGECRGCLHSCPVRATPQGAQAPLPRPRSLALLHRRRQIAALNGPSGASLTSGVHPHDAARPVDGRRSPSPTLIVHCGWQPWCGLAIWDGRWRAVVCGKARLLKKAAARVEALEVALPAAAWKGEGVTFSCSPRASLALVPPVGWDSTGEQTSFPPRGGVGRGASPVT